MEKMKIAFFTGTLDIGGIERAIINYVNGIDKDKYDITLFLEQANGVYLSEVDKNVHIINFNLCTNKNFLIRKSINMLKLLKYSIKYYHKFDFAACFKSTIKSGAILSLKFSPNNAFWFHGNYFHDEDSAKKFCKHFKVNKYAKIVFVSNSLKEKYCKLIGSNNQRLYVLNNPTNYDEIIKKSNEEIDIKKNKITFLNVGRHSEEEKNLSMLFNCVKRLINEKYDFELWLIGSGKDTDYYKDLVHKLKIDKYVKFLGFSSNVYPYIKKCDAVVLTSKEEGNPVVFLETKILNKPIITTNVSDALIDIKGFGIVTEHDEESFYLGLKEYLKGNVLVKKFFDYQKYDKDILNKLYKIMED